MSRRHRARHVLITRRLPEPSPFRSILEAAGRQVLDVPMIEIRPELGPGVDSVLQQLDDYDWVVFTSANAVRIFLGRASQLHIPLSVKAPQVCAVGPATGRAVESYGLEVSMIPKLSQAEGVVQEFLEHYGGNLSGLSILFPMAKQARPILPRGLRSQGAHLEALPIYDTILPSGSRLRLLQTLREQTPELIAFTSSSTVRHFVSVVGAGARIRNFPYAAIGPVTAEMAAVYGLQVRVQPSRPTLPDLARSIVLYLEEQASGT